MLLDVVRGEIEIPDEPEAYASYLLEVADLLRSRAALRAAEKLEAEARRELLRQGVCADCQGALVPVERRWEEAHPYGSTVAYEHRTEGDGWECVRCGVRYDDDEVSAERLWG